MDKMPNKQRLVRVDARTSNGIPTSDLATCVAFHSPNVKNGPQNKKRAESTGFDSLMSASPKSEVDFTFTDAQLQHNNLGDASKAFSKNGQFF